MAPSVALWCVRPRKRLAAALGRVVHAAPARRECVVYPDGNSDAAKTLGISIRTLRNKLNEYRTEDEDLEIEPEDL